MWESVATAGKRRAFGEDAAWEVERDQTARLVTCVRKFASSAVQILLPRITTIPIQHIVHCFSQSDYKTRLKPQKDLVQHLANLSAAGRHAVRTASVVMVNSAVTAVPRRHGEQRCDSSSTSSW